MTHTRRRPFALLVLALPCFTACQDADLGPAAALRTDSAGIEIVDHPAALVEALPQWHLSAAPRLDIGLTDGSEEYQLFRVSGVSVLPGDSVVVVNGGSQEIRFYDGDGRFVCSAGRKGEGPGEFGFPIGVWPIGDSVAIWDPQLRRISIFDHQGRLVRVVAPERRGLNPNLVGIFAGESFVTQDLWLAIGESMAPMPLHFVAFNGKGEFQDSLPSRTLAVMGRLGDSGLVGGALFGFRTATTSGSRSYWVGSGEEPEVERFASDGTLLQLVRWHGGDRMVGQDEVDRYWAEQLANRTSDDSRAQLQELKRSQPVAETFPALEELHGTRQDGLWIKRYRRPSDDGPNRWLVADSSGAFVATIETPENLRIFEIGPDYVAGDLPDDMDVEHVVVFGIERQASGR